MSNDFDEGFIDDDDDDYFGNEEDSASVEEGSSSGPFLMLLAGLVGVFIIAAICVMAVVAIRRTDNGQDEKVAAIEATNAVIQETNVAVTVAIQATETAKAELAAVQPTFTPEIDNTPTPEVEATETPVVKQATATIDAETGTGEESGKEGTPGGEESAGGDGDKDGSGAGNGTIVGGGDGDVHTPTPTPISSTSGGDNNGGKDSTLPDTGLEDWGFALIGLALIAVLLGARKLRTH